jgi:hypothetical protein
MSTSAPGVLDRLSLASVQQRVLHAVVLASSLVLVVLPVLVEGEFSPLFAVPALVLAALAALLPESNLPLALVLWLGVLWLRSMPDEVSAWTLVAAVDLAVLHAACTLASYGPPGLRLDATLLRRWGRRFVLCVAAAVLTWTASEVVAFLDLPPSRLVLALALAALLAWAGLLAARLGHARPD